VTRSPGVTASGPRRPLRVTSLAVSEPLVGTPSLVLELALDRDVDPLHVHRRLLELVEELADEHAGRVARGEAP